MTETPADFSPSWSRWLLDCWPWMVVALLTLAATATSTALSFQRYEELRSGWSWDLAYYNQWFWSLNFGDRTITVRPLSSYGAEGPPIWVMNYLAPVRLLIAPFYRLAPGPRTLLVIQNVVLWWVIPAAYTLVRSETRSRGLAVAAAALVPLTPLLWPLALNDFRELQLALPFVIWAVQGVRSRSLRVAAFGIGGMLACRQEYAILLATLAIVPAREREDFSRSFRWAHGLIVIGLGWFLLGFFAYLRFAISPESPLQFIRQFQGDKAPLNQALPTSIEVLAIGLGAWSLFLVFAPRVSVLVLPWLWSLAGGMWAMRFLGQEEWHHVRYVALFTSIGLAAGLVGFARLGAWLLARRRGRPALVLVWLFAAAGSALGLWQVSSLMARQPYTIDAAEARAVWKWIDQVGPEDGVLAVYDVTAPLSSRRELYSYVLAANVPKGYPILDRSILWAFLDNARGDAETFQKQGFEVVHRGPYLTILRRDRR